MKPGDLVRIVNTEVLYPDEPRIGIYWSDDIPFEDWGMDVAGQCDCLVFWNGMITPFNREDLEVVGENR